MALEKGRVVGFDIYNHLWWIDAETFENSLPGPCARANLVKRTLYEAVDAVGNKAALAARLGIGRNTLYAYLRGDENRACPYSVLMCARYIIAHEKHLARHGLERPTDVWEKR